MSKLNRLKICKTGVRLASRIGYQNVTLGKLATELKVSRSAFRHHFHNVAELRVAILNYAIKVDNAAIVVQAIACNDPLVDLMGVSKTDALRAMIDKVQ